MKQRNAFKLFLNLGLFFAAIGSMAQAIDNPYRTRYGGLQHWSDSLSWGNIIDATTRNVTPANDSVTNINNLRLLIDSLSAAGGGVIYFPAGLYNFSDSLELKSGVILRGETPTTTDARDSLYRPQSKLNFPKYIFDTTANGGNGTSNNTAFKWITCAANASNFGLVNLDINRAKVFFMPKNYYHAPNPKGNGGWAGGALVNGVPGTMLPTNLPQNVLVYGIRENNVALPDPLTPKMVPGWDQKAWQRYSWCFGSYIDIVVAKNGVVANCRLGDETTDNFNQPGYKGNNCALNLPKNDGGLGAAFNYTDHYGIQLNRFKTHGGIGSGLNSPMDVYANILYAYPDDEPMLYAPGNEILDNWIFKTMRVAIIAAGSKLKIKRNETHDLAGKIVYLLPGGTGCSVHGSTTFENRGIDFSGWGLEVDSNNIEVFQHYSPKTGANTPDGEFMLLQECCGGTPVNDYTLRGNVGNSYIGFYFIRDINNLKILNNTANVNIHSNFPNGIFVAADVYNSSVPGNFVPYSLTNTIIDGNTTSSGITATGSKGGYNVTVSNNNSLNNYKITASCFVDVQTNNTGFASVQYKTVSSTRSGVDTTSPCTLDPANFPAIAWVYPKWDTLIDYDTLQLRNSYAIKVVSRGGNLNQELANIYLNGSKVAARLPFDLSDSTVNFIWTIPNTPNQIYNLSAEIWDTVTHIHNFTTPIKVEVRKILGVEKQAEQLLLMVYPNPVNTGSIKFVREAQGPATISITDITGYGLRKVNLSQDQTDTEITGLHLPAGFYLLNYSDGKTQKQFKLIFK